MTTLVSQCLTCKNFILRGPGVQVCRAFPQGIPREILFNREDHRDPHPGDQGVRYEPLDGEQSPFSDDNGE